MTVIPLLLCLTSADLGCGTAVRITCRQFLAALSLLSRAARVRLRAPPCGTELGPGLWPPRQAGSCRPGAEAAAYHPRLNAFLVKREVSYVPSNLTLQVE